ncbi:large ribosomal subunit protein mL49 [Gavia stellata]|uniref:large ribosomal subunit protein mL49 n=1 Tax=Gavia stellata TaxID=37040 RepID=UPI00289EA99D|nr:large ribosomal subunit protein mL49 [Gavia stellata]
MAAMAALGRRLRELGRAVGWRGVQGPPNPQPPGVVESTADYAFVERLLPPTRIPEPPPHPTYPTPSGWSPPKGPPPALPYFVRRSRLHNLPVYARLVKGNRRLTEVQHVEGDIWALERELREFLGGLGVKELEVQVNEVTGRLRLKGHWEQELRGWLLQRGF